jgi:arylsulfatase A-like enzyme
VKILKGLLLAVLICAALDTAFTRAGHDHRPDGWVLPLQALAGWAVLAILIAWPARLTAGWMQAGFTAALVWLAGPVLLHHAVALGLRSRGGLDSLQDYAIPVATLLGLLVFAWLMRRIEHGFVKRHAVWSGRIMALVALFLLAPHDGSSGDGAQAQVDAGPNQPNLLLLVWDTTRADHLQSYDDDRKTTPNLAEVGRAGTVFDRAWSSSVFTLSSHASMLTGLPPALHGTTLRRQAFGAPSLPAMLRAAGYRTGSFVGTSVLRAGAGLERGFDVFDDLVDPPLCDTHLWSMVHDVQAALAAKFRSLRGNGNPHWFQDFQRPGREVLDHALDFIAEDDERPWFVMVNLFDVHWPYLPGPESSTRFVRPYDGPLDGYVFRSNDYPRGYHPDTSDMAYLSDLYDAELWELDREVDRFLGELNLPRGDTFVLMTADHGEAFGEGGSFSHEELHTPQTRVPLLLYAPGHAVAGLRSDEPASGVDVTPTMLELAGITPAEDLVLAGRSLLAPPADEPRVIFLQDHDNVDPDADHHAVLRGEFKLLRRRNIDTLHMLASDPMDEVDISDAHPQVARELAEALDALLAAQVRSTGGIDNLDALRALGYVGDTRR